LCQAIFLLFKNYFFLKDTIDLERIIKYYFPFFFVKHFFYAVPFYLSVIGNKKGIFFTFVYVVCQQKIKVFLINYYYLFAEESIGQNK